MHYFNLASHIKRRISAEGVLEWGSEEDMWVCKGGSDRRLEETA
jgi:hypothetical protein